MKNKSRYPSFSFKQNKIYKTYRDINWSLQGLKHFVPSITQDRPIIEFPDKYQSLFLNKVAGRNFIEKETPAHVFSCEFCESSKNTFS